MITGIVFKSRNLCSASWRSGDSGKDGARLQIIYLTTKKEIVQGVVEKSNHRLLQDIYRVLNVDMNGETQTTLQQSEDHQKPTEEMRN